MGCKAQRKKQEQWASESASFSPSWDGRGGRWEPVVRPGAWPPLAEAQMEQPLLTDAARLVKRAVCFLPSHVPLSCPPVTKGLMTAMLSQPAHKLFFFSSAQRLRKIFLLSACVWFTFFIVFYCIKMVPQVKCLKMYWVKRLMSTPVLIPPVLSPWWEIIYVGFSMIPPRLLYAKIE